MRTAAGGLRFSCGTSVGLAYMDRNGIPAENPADILGAPGEDLGVRGRAAGKGRGADQAAGRMPRIFRRSKPSRISKSPSRRAYPATIGANSIRLAMLRRNRIIARMIVTAPLRPSHKSPV